MLNQITVVGKLQEIKEQNEDGIKIVLKVSRAYKDKNKIDTDYLLISMPGGIGAQVLTHVEIGDILGIKGRMEGQLVNNEYKVEIIAEKVTFLSSKQDKED